MYEVTVATTDDMQVEVDARLAAMGTFLRELDGDPAARALLMRFVVQIGELIAQGISSMDHAPRQLRPLRNALAELKNAVRALPETGAADPLQWQRLRRRHQACHVAFKNLSKALPDRGISRHLAHRHDAVAMA
jgi:hypothetical protein